MPGILKAVPLDRFSGEPLRYRREGGGYVLYSVASDLDDDGGSAQRQVQDRRRGWHLDGDMVWRVER